MAIEYTDPTATKTIDITGSKVVIKPLIPNKRTKALVVAGHFENATSDETDFKTIRKNSMIVAANADRDKLAELIFPAIVSIDGEKITLKQLIWMGDEAFWKIASAIIPYDGLNEEQVKNSDSSSASDVLESTGDAGKLTKMEDTPVKTEGEPVSITLAKKAKRKTKRQAR